MSARHKVVIGVDGSPSSRAALEHAAVEAVDRRLPLELVHSWEAYPLYDGAMILDLDEVELAESQLLTAAADHLREVHPELEVTTRLVQQRADAALIDASRDAELLVVGCHRGRPSWLGPVLSHVAVHAACPVVAVPAGPQVPHGDVVVGVDGSAVSARAVEHAFEQAERRGVRLVAVHAVTPTFDAYVPSEAVLEELLDRGRRHLAESLAGWCERHPDVVVEQQVSLDGALPALQRAGSTAGLLVVGSHGRGALLRAALGSVSSSVLRAAPCPVAVVLPHQGADGSEVHAGADAAPAGGR